MEKFRITYTKTDRDGSTKTCVLFDNNGQGYTLPEANEKMLESASKLAGGKPLPDWDAAVKEFEPDYRNIHALPEDEEGRRAIEYRYNDVRWEITPVTADAQPFELEDFLYDHDLDFNEIEPDDNGHLMINVERGDWKHSHMALDFYMKFLGYKRLFERVTYSDGSDNYSSIHYYEKTTEEK